MTSERSGSGAWEAIGKVATIVTILASAVAIWIWYKTPTSSLVAEIEYGTYRSSPELLAKVHELESGGKGSDKSRSLASTAAEDAAAAAAEVAAIAAQAAAEVASDSKRISGEGYVKAIITNKGDIPVKDVTFRTLDSNVNLITREDKSYEVVRNQPAINLGELKPNQSIEVYSWTYFPPSRYTLADEISVSHAEGRGDIEIEDDPSIPEILIYGPMSVLTLLFFFILIGLVFFWGMKTGYDLHRSESEKNPAQDKQPTV